MFFERARESVVVAAPVTSCRRPRAPGDPPDQTWMSPDVDDGDPGVLVEIFNGARQNEWVISIVGAEERVDERLGAVEELTVDVSDPKRRLSRSR